MKWSWPVGRLFGIQVFVHWTFLLLLAWIAASYLLAGNTIGQALYVMMLIVAFFGCIVLHELGHALTARRFGIATKDITLLPIGGVARLERMPEEPRQELLIAVAGPAVNVAIAAVVYVLLAVQGGVPQVEAAVDLEGSFLLSMLVFNVVVVLFNLLPAFPMDGGRVLRALLATRMSYVRATTVAAGVGQFMAVLFGLVGLLLPNPFLVLIALFVYLGADAEARAAQFKAATSDVPVHEAMMTRYRTLSPDDSLDEAARELLAGSQHDFPVVENSRLCGVLCREDLMRGLSEPGRKLKVRDVMRSDIKAVDSSETLDEVLQHAQQGGCGTLPVVQNGRMVGLLTLDNVDELIQIRAAREHEPRLANESSEMLDQT